MPRGAGLTASDYADLIDALTDATDVAVAAGQYLPPRDNRALRKEIKKEQQGARGRAVSADADRILRHADEEGVNPGPALFANAILLAANNGYDAQITDFILGDLLDPRFVDTKTPSDPGEGLLRVHGPFPARRSDRRRQAQQEGKPEDVFRVLETEPPPNEEVDEEPDMGSVAAGTYRGRFTGKQIETLIAASYPGATQPIANEVEITVSGAGVMRFAFLFTYRAAWVTDNGTVTCESVYEIFETVTPRPTAKLSSDSPRFESRPFVVSSVQRDFSGPKRAEFPYDGSNDTTLLEDAPVVGRFEDRDVRRRGCLRRGGRRGQGTPPSSSTRLSHGPRLDETSGPSVTLCAEPRGYEMTRSACGR